MLKDHLVSFRREEEIANLAERLRSHPSFFEQLELDIVSLIGSLVGQVFAAKGSLSFELFSKNADEYDAYVSFSPLRLCVDDELWGLAKLGDLWSRFVLAHELGHVVLHDKNAKAFSGKNSGFGLFGSYEVSAEWQANLFAGHLLAPDWVMGSVNSAEELATACKHRSHTGC